MPVLTCYLPCEPIQLMMNDRELRDLAWIGDAVLALHVREWLLKQPPTPRISVQQQFVFITSNGFLQRFGEPTRVEARIGRIYLDEGLHAAAAHIEETILPTYLKHLAKRLRQRPGNPQALP